MLEKIPVCIASVYRREPEFAPLRSLAKEIIARYPFLQPIRSPEDVKTQSEFNSYLQEALALIVIFGDVPSDSVQEEVRLAISSGIPVIPFYKTKSLDPSLMETSEVISTLNTMWGLGSYIIFTTPDDFRNILEYQVTLLITRKIKSQVTIYDNRLEIYKNGISKIVNSNQFVVVGEVTPSFILGARAGDIQRKEYYDACLKMLDRLSKNELGQLSFVFNYDETKKAINDKDKYPYLEDAQRNLANILPSLINKNLIIRGVESKFSPFIIADYTISYGLNFADVARYMEVPQYNIPRHDLTSLIGRIQRTGQFLSIKDVLAIYD